MTETPHAFRGLRVLITHEWIHTWAGAERCLGEMLAMFPTADVLVGVLPKELRDLNYVSRRATESWVGRLPLGHRKHRWFLPLHAFSWASVDVSQYDLVISSSHAFGKNVPVRGRTRHVCYCYSPPRYLWDLYEQHLELATPVQRMALRLAVPALRALDLKSARTVHRFASISKYVATRVQRVYGAPSDVVYPPVSAKPHAASAPESGAPYLLYLGRLVEYKRVDLLVKAAELLKHRLIVAGNGPDRERLERLAGPHTEFLGSVTEERAAALLSGCSAFVFAGEEEFGIAMVEANAHGRPVVCYGRGAAVETMIPGETAVLFDRQDAASVARGVEQCLGTRWDGARVRANAERFSPQRFRDGLGRVIEAELKRTSR